MSNSPPGSSSRELLSSTTRLLLLVVLLGATAGAADGASSSSLDRARAKLAAGQLDDAAQSARAALRSSPRDPQAHVVLGSVLLFQGKTAEAAKSFQFALALDARAGAEIGSAYLAAVRHFAANTDHDAAEACLSRAVEHDANLFAPAVDVLFADALTRFRAGDALGAALLTRWSSAYPDYSPRAEEDLFTLAGYHEAEGRLSEAVELYERCAREHPEGELGRRAAELLLPRRITLDRLLSVSCENRLFVELRGLELGYDFTRAELAFVWVSADRSGAPERTVHLLPDSQLEIVGSEPLPAIWPEGGRNAGRRIELRTDLEHRVVLSFPPIPRHQEIASLLVANDACGTGSRRGGYTLSFADVPLATAWASSADRALAPPSLPREREVEVIHIHDYFIAAGLCTGTLHLSPQGISYRSGPHSFELSCEDVLRVAEGRKEIVVDPLGRLGQVGMVPTLLIEGRETGRKGREKTTARHFLAADGTPPVLLLSKNPCGSGAPHGDGLP